MIFSSDAVFPSVCPLLLLVAPADGEPWDADSQSHLQSIVSLENNDTKWDWMLYHPQAPAVYIPCFSSFAILCYIMLYISLPLLYYAYYVARLLAKLLHFNP